MRSMTGEESSSEARWEPTKARSWRLKRREEEGLREAGRELVQDEMRLFSPDE